MIDRVTKNLKTTIAGSILFVTGIALVAFEKANIDRDWETKYSLQ